MLSCLCWWVCAVLSRFSCVRLFVTLWTIAHQAPLSTAFSRQEYWSGLSCPPPGDLPDPGIEPASLTSPALAGRFFTTSATQEGNTCYCFRVENDGATCSDWVGKVGRVQEETSPPCCSLATCSWYGAHGLERSLGFKKRLYAFTCPPGSGGNVLVCLGLVLLTWFLGPSFAETPASCSPPPLV